MTILGISAIDLVLAVSVVALGAAIQAAVGFGLALIAAPALLLINRDLVPGPLIAAALYLVCWVAWKERQSIDYSHLKAALMGRLIGSPPAAYLMGTVSAVTFDLLFGGLVLIAVILSLIHTNITASSRNVFLATIASGFMSTISSIGGPPVALVYQNASGPALRANLSVLFIMGCVVSLSALIIVDRFHLEDLLYSFLLFIGVFVGMSCSGPLIRIMDKRSARPWLLGLCTFSSLLVLGRAVYQLI